MLSKEVSIPIRSMAKKQKGSECTFSKAALQPILMVLKPSGLDDEKSRKQILDGLLIYSKQNRSGT